MITARVIRVRRLLGSLSDNPGYTLMRGFARFSVLRFLVPHLRGLTHKIKRYLTLSLPSSNENLETIFSEVDIDSIVTALKTHGVAFGLKLPQEIVESIRKYANQAVCYADRNPSAGFDLENRDEAEALLGKKILIAQYFNTLSDSPHINRLARDPVLWEIANRYLNSPPTFVGANLWWTFPVDASEEDRHRHAHRFHRDVDDFKFFKFFFYLSDVEDGDGAHVCVLGSQGRPPCRNIFDRWVIRRYSDEEIEQQYLSSQIMEISGSAGDGFAEDTWCIHKAKTPSKNPRLLLQLQFALFDYGAMHDRRTPKVLKKLG